MKKVVVGFESVRRKSLKDLKSKSNNCFLNNVCLVGKCIEKIHYSLVSKVIIEKTVLYSNI